MAGFSGARMAFTRQPFYYLCIDVGSVPEMTMDYICSGLSDALALASSIRGSPRIPALGLTAVVNDKLNQLLLPLQTVKGNFVNVSKAISDLKALARNVSEESAMNATSVKRCLEEVMVQFAAFKTKSGLDGGKDWHHLQITFMTRHTSTPLIKLMEEMLTSTKETCNMIKIQVVTLESVLPQDPETLINSDSSQSPTTLTANESLDYRNDVFSGMVDTLTMRGNMYDLAGFFKSWLHDHSTDKEHLWLTLPSDSGIDKKITILCDVSEPHLNPGAFVFGDHFFLSVDPLVSHGLLTVQAKHTSGSQVEIPKLEAFQSVKIGGICESTVFGIPLRLQPTICWKMEWSELEANRQRFQAMAQTLREQDTVLVTRLKQTLYKETPWKTDTMQIYYGIFSAGDSLLVKSLATSELLLPLTNAQMDSDYIPDEIKSLVQSSLETLPSLKKLNPIHLKCGLYSVLRTCLGNSRGFSATKGSAQTAKPVFRSACSMMRNKW